MRALFVWLLALAVLLAAPAASLAECLRCPPDCPMHVRRAPVADDGASPHGTHHAGHEAEHAAHGDAHAASAGGQGDCHRKADAAPRPGDGPCISGTCGHMDASLARVLPEAVLARPRVLAPVVAGAPLLVAATPPATRAADEPPTEPPRALPS
ncbi:MAG: hypothetical protein AB1689_23875 [Thermodesulfobacteriota bacterium]